MPDPYAFITQADQSVQVRLADVLELRAADPQQRAMLDRYLAEIELPKGARVLEVGCGTGAVSRRIAELFEVRDIVGVDPSPVFLERARELAKHLSRVSFCQGDGRSLEFADESFDLVVFHTALCHIPDPQKAVREAHRVLCPAGWLAAFDGDYTTSTVALGDFDPLQPVVEAMVAHFVHDRWLVRRLPKMLSSAGFDVKSFRSHGYTQTTDPTYMLTIVDRGADLLAETGSVGAEEARALKSEARRRVTAGQFFGHISFVNVIARRPK
jgi:ubiquinone/menaquinone biosynthesis C-methylase UbiE